jgi:hypothetical protein
MLIAVAPAAHAGPVGNQYLPQVPKAGGHHHSGGTSGETSSSYAPTTTTSESTQPTRTKHEKPAKPKHHEKAKQVKVAPASGDVSAGSDGGAWVPLAVFAFAAIVSTAVGLALRRRAA